MMRNHSGTASKFKVCVNVMVPSHVHLNDVKLSARILKRPAAAPNRAAAASAATSAAPSAAPEPASDATTHTETSASTYTWKPDNYPTAHWLHRIEVVERVNL